MILCRCCCGGGENVDVNACTVILSVATSADLVRRSWTVVINDWRTVVALSLITGKMARRTNCSYAFTQGSIYFVLAPLRPGATCSIVRLKFCRSERTTESEVVRFLSCCCCSIGCNSTVVASPTIASPFLNRFGRGLSYFKRMNAISNVLAVIQIHSQVVPQFTRQCYEICQNRGTCMLS